MVVIKKSILKGILINKKEAKGWLFPWRLSLNLQILLCSVQAYFRSFL